LQDGGTALIAAAQNGHGAVVRLLLEHKASVDAPDQVVTRMRE
jgi:ankyrin repeat protein